MQVDFFYNIFRCIFSKFSNEVFERIVLRPDKAKAKTSADKKTHQQPYISTVHVAYKLQEPQFTKIEALIELNLLY